MPAKTTAKKAAAKKDEAVANPATKSSVDKLRGRVDNLEKIIATHLGIVIDQDTD